jgi:hypothetical protein
MKMGLSIYLYIDIYGKKIESQKESICWRHGSRGRAPA